MAKKKLHISGDSPDKQAQIRITAPKEGGIKIRSRASIADKYEAEKARYQQLRQRLFWGGGMVGGLLLLTLAFYLLRPERDVTPSPKAGPQDAQESFDRASYALPPNAYYLQGDTFWVTENAALENIGKLRQRLEGYDISLTKQQEVLASLSFQGQLNASMRYLLLARFEAKDKPVRFIFEPNESGQTLFDLENESVGPVVIRRNLRFETRSHYGLIGGAYWSPLRNTELGFNLFNQMEEVLLSKVNFYRVGPGDQFKILYRVKLLDDKPREITEIKAIQFTPKGESPIYAYHYPTKGRDAFFDEQGRTLHQAFWRAPVKFAQVSSQFGVRFHPTEKDYRLHEGVDFAANAGSPVYAVADGKVLRAQSDHPYNGNFVELQHISGYTTLYLHMQSFAAGIKAGAAVKQGDVIGYVGNTGRSTGPHVCFHLRQNGKAIDSQTAPLPEPKPMNAADLPAFFVLRDSLRHQLDDIRTFTLP